MIRTLIVLMVFVLVGTYRQCAISAHGRRPIDG